MVNTRKIGILTGGGDCPGLNAAIRAVAKSAIKKGFEVVGIRDGWKGLIEDDTELLDEIKTSGIIDRGGTILGTSRVSPFYVDNGSQRVFDGFKLLGLEALVVLGGNGTLSATSRLSQMGLRVVGIPKTIDNDVVGTHFTIGFQTAVQIATDALDRLRSTAESHHRVMILEVMGRDAGWIATYAGMANGAEAILIPEIPLNERRMDALCQVLETRSKKGRRYSILVVAEGTKLEAGVRGGEAIEIPKKEGSPSLGGIANVIGEIIKNRTGLDNRVSSLGYVQRGGSPVAYDRSLATAFGVKAVQLIEEKKYGEMVALKGNRISSIPLEQMADRIKTVNLKIYELAEIFFW